MAINSYFFNAIKDGQGNYDRLYNAEDVTHYLDKVVGSGVFPNPSTQLQVRAGTGMEIIVNEGQGWINGHKIVNTADLNLEVSAADVLMGRIDRVIFYTDSTERTMGIEILEGTPAVRPVAPALTRSDSRYEMCLATISVNKGITAITDSLITDTRADSSVCGWVAGLVQQVDTSSLFVQWNSAYTEMMETMRSWQQSQREIFDAWYYDLTQNLTVGAYIKKFSKVVEGGTGVGNIISLDMEGYEYDSNDIIIANLNGLILQLGYDYILNTGVNPVQIQITAQLTSGNRFEVVILKSNMSQTTGGLLTSARGIKFIHVEDAKPGAAHGFSITVLGSTNEIAVANRNLFRLDLIDDAAEGGLTFDKNQDGSITIDGTTTESNVGVNCNIDKNAFVVGQAYTISSGKTLGNSQVKLTLTYSDNTTEDFISKNSPTTFVVPKEVTSAVGYIEVENNETVIDDEVIRAQLEVGDIPTDFLPNTYSTFIYNGVVMPVLTDTIDNVWTNDDGASDLLLVYIVLGSEVDGDNIEY